MTLTLEGLVLALPTQRIGPLDIAFGPGIVHLRGPNGSGKTTLLRVLCAELTPTEGRVRLDGADPARSPETRGRFAFLPAVPELPGFLTVRESWAIFAALRRRPAWDGGAFCRSLDLDPARRLDQLSVGQRRKAELIAALAGDPDVLLLDELFAPLDAASVTLVAALLDTWRDTRLMMLTGHGEMPLAPDARLDLVAGLPRTNRPFLDKGGPVG